MSRVWSCAVALALCVSLGVGQYVALARHARPRVLLSGAEHVMDQVNWAMEKNEDRFFLCGSALGALGALLLGRRRATSRGRRSLLLALIPVAIAQVFWGLRAIGGLPANPPPWAILTALGAWALGSLVLPIMAMLLAAEEGKEDRAGSVGGVVLPCLVLAWFFGFGFTEILIGGTA